jgi:hypothetical protein
MGEDLHRVIERASTRPRWTITPVGQNGRFRVCSPDDQIVADDLSRGRAEQLAGSFNAVRDDAATLAEHLRRAPPLRLR